jgi:squalene synthase HpnC
MDTINPPENPYRVDRDYSLDESRRYCTRLAKSHYENFLVATFFIPSDLKQDFYNLYAYCRISDDLGDESGGAEKALPLLDWWEEELKACYKGVPRHPVFKALEVTNQRHKIPIEPYLDLLTAFRQDQVVKRYDTYESLLSYCKFSANPVGRLVLYLCGYSDSQRQKLSDATCTALQLANFWQDVARDYEIGRIYIPQEDMERFHVSEKDIAAKRFTPQFAELMRFECERTMELFQEGMALRSMVHRKVRLDIEMFGRGGMEVLRLIKARNYDVLTKRPEIPKSRQIAILLRRMLSI